MDLSETLIFNELSSDVRVALLALAQQRQIAAGDQLFEEGEVPGKLWLLLSGRCMLSQDAEPRYEARRHEVLDVVAALGGIPHTIRAIATGDCEFLCWDVDDLWANPVFSVVARHYLASHLQRTQVRLDELEMPVHYREVAQLTPGPFMFRDTTLLIAFCEADLDSWRELLPEGLTLFRRAGRKRDSLFLATAFFRHAYPADDPDGSFRYSETTCFVPVREGRNFGLFPAYIYPSTWEPILLGRDIYGFPKRLGNTVFGENCVSLSVDRIDHFELTYGEKEQTSESRLVRALSDWVGIEGRVAEAAFRAGDALRSVARLPSYRRVDVYNHKRIPAADSTHDVPTYAVDQLTQAIFGVLTWHEIAKLHDPALTVRDGPLASVNPTLREAYLTRLDMRLSAGRVVRDNGA
jgi:hypothetical protein